MNQKTISSIDIFSHVIDNFGDAGVALRLASELSYRIAHHPIRLFTDAYELTNRLLGETCICVNNAGANLSIHPWTSTTCWNDLTPADLIIETFGCDIPTEYLKKAYVRGGVWFNLEYLSAESWIEECHLGESLLDSGSLRKFFFMPGFTKATGGLITRAIKLTSPHTAVPNAARAVRTFAQSYGYTPTEPEFIGFLFCYDFEHASFFDALVNYPTRILLIACGDQAHEAVKNNMKQGVRETNFLIHEKNLTVLLAPFVNQASFDTLIAGSDFALIRGEDSLAQAVLAHVPCIWDIYKQERSVHTKKLIAFLDRIKPFFADQLIFTGYQELMHQYNSDSDLTTTLQWIWFLNNLSPLKQSAVEFASYLNKNCNLCDQMLFYATQFLNQSREHS